MMIVEGLGIHTGRHCTVGMERIPDPAEHGGPEFDIFEPGTPIPAGMLRHLAVTAKNSTILEDGSGNRFQTPEHLLGTLVCFPEAPVCITGRGGETPGMDGSGLPYLELLRALFGSGILDSLFGIETCLSSLNKDYSCPNGFFRVSPADSFSIRYIMSAGELEHVYELDTAAESFCEQVIRDILPARTFCTWSEYNRGKSAGLMKGAGPQSGLLIAENREDFGRLAAEFPELQPEVYPFLNRNGFRMENELACHKILDLIGDLALNGLTLPRLRLEIKNGGHVQNHLLLKDLIHEQNS